MAYYEIIIRPTCTVFVEADNEDEAFLEANAGLDYGSFKDYQSLSRKLNQDEIRNALNECDVNLTDLSIDELDE